MANIGIEEYRNFIENANSIIIRFDPQGNFTYLNNFAQHFFGFTEKELIGKSLIGTIVPSTDFSGKDLEAMINDLLTNPQKYINNENENITKDGRHVWISWTNKPLLGTSGQLEEILSIGNDISQLKRIEVELKKAEELVESTGRIGTIICEANWQVRSFNSAAKKYFCSGEQEPDCHDLVALFFKDYTPSLPIEKIRDLSIPHLTFDLVRPESATNKALYLQVNREIIRTQRAVVSIILSIQDVTEQRQEELLKQDFLSHISHKLRTPVTVIMESARMLKAGTLGPLSEKQQPLINAL
jgi:PAS domain S-box-containing protein